MSAALSPAAALHDRMDQIRESNSDLASQLRNMAGELPSTKIQREIGELAGQLDINTNSSEIAHRFPNLCWLLTMRPGPATADAFAETLSFSVMQNQLQRKRFRAIAYPSLLSLLSAGMFLAACATIVPMFDEMFQEFELQLPPMTLALVEISRFVVGQPLATAGIVLLGIAALATVIWLWVGDSQLKRVLIGTSPDRFRSRHGLAKAAIQVAELTEGGVETARALQVVAASSTDVFITGTFSELATRLPSDSRQQLLGSRPARALPSNFAVALFGSDSNTPNATLLRQLAANYRELSIDRRDWSAFLLAQLALILVGLLLAFVVIALFAPMFGLVSALSS